MDIDSCKAADSSVHLPQDEEMVTDVEGDDINMLDVEPTNDDARSSNVQQFGNGVSVDADAGAYDIHRHRKVGRCMCCLMKLLISDMKADFLYWLSGQTSVWHLKHI